VHLADGSGQVSVIGEDLCPGLNPTFVQVGSQEMGIVQHAVLDRIASAQQQTSRRNTYRGGRIRSRIPNPFRCEGVDVGCRDEIGTVATEKVGPQLIGHDEQEIRAWCRHESRMGALMGWEHGAYHRKGAFRPPAASEEDDQ